MRKPYLICALIVLLPFICVGCMPKVQSTYTMGYNKAVDDINIKKINAYNKGYCDALITQPLLMRVNK